MEPHEDLKKHEGDEKSRFFLMSKNSLLHFITENIKEFHKTVCHGIYAILWEAYLRIFKGSYSDMGSTCTGLNQKEFSIRNFNDLK